MANPLFLRAIRWIYFGVSNACVETAGVPFGANTNSERRGRGAATHCYRATYAATRPASSRGWEVQYSVPSFSL